jgi:hypothetical protein
MRTAEELLDEMCEHKENKEQALELFEELLTYHFAEYLRLVSDDDLLKCVHDDRVALPTAWITQEDWKDLGDSYEDFISKDHPSFGTKQKAIEAELNRRGISWRQYSDEERDCLWLLQHLTYPTTVATPEEIEEFRRLVKANGGNVPRIKFSPSERTKSQLEAIGLTAEWTREDDGYEWVEIKGLKEAA